MRQGLGKERKSLGNKRQGNCAFEYRARDTFYYRDWSETTLHAHHRFDRSQETRFNAAGPRTRFEAVGPYAGPDPRQRASPLNTLAAFSASPHAGQATIPEMCKRSFQMWKGKCCLLPTADRKGLHVGVVSAIESS